MPVSQQSLRCKYTTYSLNYYKPSKKDNVVEKSGGQTSGQISGAIQLINESANWFTIYILRLSPEVSGLNKVAESK